MSKRKSKINALSPAFSELDVSPPTRDSCRSWACGSGFLRFLSSTFYFFALDRAQVMPIPRGRDAFSRRIGPRLIRT
jgi:hypothetical protein